MSALHILHPVIFRINVQIKYSQPNSGMKKLAASLVDS